MFSVGYSYLVVHIEFASPNSKAISFLNHTNYFLSPAPMLARQSTYYIENLAGYYLLLKGVCC